MYKDLKILYGWLFQISNPSFENCVDPTQLASDEAIRSQLIKIHTVFHLLKVSIHLIYILSSLTMEIRSEYDVHVNNW